MMRYAPALGSHFCQTLSAAVVCPLLDISSELTPDRIITELSRPALRAHLTEDLSSKAILAQNRGGRPATYEPWTGDCEATRSGPIGLAETRGNGYVFSDTLLKKKKNSDITHVLPIEMFYFLRITVLGNQVEIVESFTYLRSLIHCSGISEPEIKRELRRLRHAPREEVSLRADDQFDTAA